MEITKIISESKDGLKREVIAKHEGHHFTRHIHLEGKKWMRCICRRTKDHPAEFTEIK